MKAAWVLYVARRYFRSKRRERGLAPSTLSVAGIAVGVLALISVLAVMNGFQLGFIEDILSISSYHLRVTTGDGPLGEAEIERLRSLKGVTAVVPFAELHTMIASSSSELQAALVRGLPDDAARVDPDLLRHLNVIQGSLDLGGGRTVVLGSELAESLSVGVGDTVSLVSLSGGALAALRPRGLPFTVSGIFRSGYYDFDQSLCLVSLASALTLGAEADRLTYGIKLADRFDDLAGARAVARALAPRKVSVESWRRYNSAFFGALRTEKLTMSFLLSLIFLVVASNIYHLLRRAVYERREEIGVLRSLGASPRSMRAVFVFDGLYIGALGATVGLVLGLLVADHINGIFALVELLASLATELFDTLVLHSGVFVGLSSDAFSFGTVPSRVLFGETLFIYLFAVFSAVAAAYLASAKASEIKPAEVLRYE